MRVVTESHQIHDDYGYVPSQEEFDALSQRVQHIEVAQTNARDLCENLRRQMQTSSDSVKAQKEKLDCLRADFIKELSSGDWRDILNQYVALSIKNLEETAKVIGEKSIKQTSAFVEQMAKAKEMIDSLKCIHSDVINSFAQFDAAQNALEGKPSSGFTIVHKCERFEDAHKECVEIKQMVLKALRFSKISIVVAVAIGILVLCLH